MRSAEERALDQHRDRSARREVGLWDAVHTEPAFRAGYRACTADVGALLTDEKVPPFGGGHGWERAIEAAVRNELRAVLRRQLGELTKPVPAVIRRCSDCGSFDDPKTGRMHHADHCKRRDEEIASTLRTRHVRMPEEVGLEKPVAAEIRAGEAFVGRCLLGPPISAMGIVRREARVAIDSGDLLSALGTPEISGRMVETAHLTLVLNGGETIEGVMIESAHELNEVDRMIHGSITLIMREGA